MGLCSSVVLEDEGPGKSPAGSNLRASHRFIGGQGDRWGPLSWIPHGSLPSMETSPGWWGWRKVPAPASRSSARDGPGGPKLSKASSRWVPPGVLFKMWTNHSLKRKPIKTYKSCCCRKRTSVWSRKGNSVLYMWRKSWTRIQMAWWTLYHPGPPEPMDMTSGNIWWSRATLNPEYLNQPSSMEHTSCLEDLMIQRIPWFSWASAKCSAWIIDILRILF